MNLRLPLQARLFGLLLLVSLLGEASVASGADSRSKASGPAAHPAPPVAKTSWPEAMLAARLRAQAAKRSIGEVWLHLEKEFPTECDWMLQDLVGLGIPCTVPKAGEQRYPARWFFGQFDADLAQRMVAHVLEELGDHGRHLRTELTRLDPSHQPAHERPWLDLYVAACRQRRERRLEPMLAKCQAFLFTKHYNLGGSHYAYTEGQSDAQAERHFTPGAALCLCRMDGATPRVRTLLADPQGVIRDPDVSYDGRRALFAWKKSDREDDYHLYEMELASGRVRQLTFGLGFADYEGAYLPNGDLVFNSTRCVQTVDCYTTEVSNFYTCNKDGKYLRRLGFDQVHTNFPTVTEDGRVLYTRWEYNDRGQIYPQALFQMLGDGTGQTEFYGNNSWFPTTILHARAIPGTQKVLAVASGHHSRQTGKLIVIDPAQGRQENAGVQLVTPVRETKAERIDAYGQGGELFQYPYPLSETEYLVTYAPWGWARPAPRFGVYLATADGRRELLAADPEISCNQAVPVRSRPALPLRPSLVDTQEQRTYYVQDVYAGPGLAGVARGTVKKLRVVALDFRAALVGGNGNRGPAGAAFVSTPVAVGNGCWDPKIVLGEAEVHGDGSASFVVPARTPVYFQAVDAKGYVVQTMRSWSTLQPGETGACVGCHESKNCVPLPYRASLATRSRPQQLSPFYGPPRGFSFPKEVQPILDRHCTRCHNDRSRLMADGRQVLAADARGADKKNPDRAFSLLSAETLDTAAKRRWSDAYLVLTHAELDPKKRFSGRSGELVDWISVQSAPPMLPPYSGGAAKSRLMTLLEEGHKSVRLSRRELDTVACWVDLLVPYGADYLEANAWSPRRPRDTTFFEERRR